MGKGGEKKINKVGDIHDPSWLVVKNHWSVVWKSVVTGLVKIVLPGHSWAIGDGGSIRFWTDRWLLERPLADIVTDVLPENHAVLLARDVWNNATGWRFENISQYVEESVCLELRAVVIDCFSGVKDRMSWKASANGEFTVKSAYRIATRDEKPKPDMSLFYRCVWRFRVPERVRMFLWLVSHQIIMTNVERKRRHLCDSDVCSVCKGDFETTLHILCDCPAMLGIWN